jgi:hypothetical protein
VGRWHYSPRKPSVKTSRFSIFRDERQNWVIGQCGWMRNAQPLGGEILRLTSLIELRRRAGCAGVRLIDPYQLNMMQACGLRKMAGTRAPSVAVAFEMPRNYSELGLDAIMTGRSIEKAPESDE